MIPTIYTPVWIDQFGLKEHRMELMSILQVFMPGGKVVGYFLNILFGQENVYIYQFIILVAKRIFY